MTIIFPANTADVINEIRDVIGRLITVNITVSGIACPLCSLDPVTGKSKDSFCSGCGGDYWLSTISGWIVNAHVTWQGAGRPIYEPGGYVLDGDCVVTISTSGNALHNIEHAESVIVDGRDLIVSNFILKGVPDINRITVALVEREG